MFNIAVLVYNITIGYNYAVLNGIASILGNKQDVRFFVAPVNVPHANDNYEYQYWSSVRVLNNRQVDGIILIPNSFSTHINYERLTDELRLFSGKPVVSISRPVDLPNSKFTINNCEKAYDQVIDHLKNRHNRKRIGFFGADLANYSESNARFEAFKKALTKHGLKFYPELVFQGDYSPGKADEVLSAVLKSKEDLNFDAMCCANDLTSAGCLLVFDRLGIKCPDDAILIGFDDAEIATQTYPTLSTINQSIPETGARAAELLYKTLKKEDCPEVLHTFSYPIYRQSCGCISCRTFSPAYYDVNGKYYEFDLNAKNEANTIIRNQQTDLFQIYDMINLIDNRVTYVDIMESLGPAMSSSNFERMLVYLYDEVISLDANADFSHSGKARLHLALDRANDRYLVFPMGEGPEINLENEFISEDYISLSSGQYFIHPVFMRNKNYGYLVCQYKMDNYIRSAINLKIISDILVNAYEYTMSIKRQEELIEDNNNLSHKVTTDELTQLFNRKGIFEYGQSLIDFSVKSNKTGAVLFCDMDGLKTINDTYGHKLGDLAIKTESDVLRSSFRKTDIIGRLSGDEFYVIAVGFSPDKIDSLRKKLALNNKKFSKQAELPINLSISVGAVAFDKDHQDLQILLQKADEELYREKQIKHGTRKPDSN